MVQHSEAAVQASEAQGHQLEVVVAYYNEDLTWLMPVASEATIYFKGLAPPSPSSFRQTIKLPNIGRESHTFLHHIVTRYDTLAETTLFTQGSVHGEACYRPHAEMTILEMKDKALKTEVGGMTTFGSETNGTLRPFDHFGWENDADNKLWMSQQKGPFLYTDCTPGQFWLETFGFGHPNSVMFAEGALFAVRAETVRSRPKAFYETLLDRFVQADHVNPEIGHFVEKFWGEIFTGVVRKDSVVV